MRVLFITNVLTPYRVYFFDLLNQQLKLDGGNLQVLVMMKPDHNMYWNYYDYEREYTKLLPVMYIKDKSDFFFNFEVKKNVLSFSPDVVIACGAYWYPTIIRVLNLCNKLHIKILYWSESNKIKHENLTGITYLVRELLRKYSYKRMDGFIYPGKYANALILDYNNDSEFNFQLPNLIDYKKYLYFNKSKEDTRTQLSIPQDAIALFCPARLSKEKGIIPFLKLYKESILKDNAVLYIAGKGPEANTIKDYIQQNKLNVILLGYINEDTMIDYYHACDYFVLPSLSDPSPLSCVEALWSGLPLILSSSIGNAPEVLNDGTNGFLFDYKDSNKTISILDRIAHKDDVWYTEAKKECLNLAKRNFKSEEIVKSLTYKLKGYMN